MDRRTYDDAALATAVAQSRSWRGVLRQLGLSATSASAIRSVKTHAQRLDLDVSHFTGRRRWSEEELVEAVRTARSWSHVATALGLSGGSSTTLLKGHAARLGVDVQHLQPPQPSPPPGMAAMVPDVRHLHRAGSAFAAAWFQLCGYDVSWPLEPCRYDLLVSRDGDVLRVQVKTTRSKRSGGWFATLSSQSGVRTYDPDDIDYFFLVDGDLAMYLIPVRTVGGLHAISLSSYAAFKLDPATARAMPG